MISIELNNFKWKPVCVEIYYTIIAALIGIRLGKYHGRM